MLTLNDLKPRTVDVEIVFTEREKVVVPLKVPSWVEWHELGMEVPVPIPEDVIEMKNGKKIYVKESGPAFDEKVAIANNKRAARRLTFALFEAGNFPELKEAALAEQLAAVESMDAGIFQALARTLNTLVSTTMGRVSDARFRAGQLSANGDADLRETELDAEEVAQTTNGG